MVELRPRKAGQGALTDIDGLSLLGGTLRWRHVGHMTSLHTLLSNDLTILMFHDDLLLGLALLAGPLPLQRLAGLALKSAQAILAFVALSQLLAVPGVAFLQKWRFSIVLFILDVLLRPLLGSATGHII